MQSRNASMLDLAPSGFRDGEEAYDSEELEGVENIVHRDVKNTEVSVTINRHDNSIIFVAINLCMLETKGITTQ